MILIDDVKYSCVECIRGHRSSSCRHHSRPLLQVRSKGRPNVHANGNPNHRIAVFAEEISSDDQKSNSPSPESDLGPTAKCKKNPVIILKASPKQVMDLQSGQIIGPYIESQVDSAAEARPPPRTINSESFINISTCCATNGISKPNKSCGCCSNKSKRNVNKSKILKTYIKSHLQKQNVQVQNNRIKTLQETSQVVGTLPYGNQFVLKSSYTPSVNGNIKHEYNDTTVNNGVDNSKQIFDVVPVASCSIPGSCCCDDSCSCEGCVVHGNSKPDDINKMIPNDFNLDYLNDLSQNNDISTNNLIFNTLPNNYPTYGIDTKSQLTSSTTDSINLVTSNAAATPFGNDYSSVLQQVAPQIPSGVQRTTLHSNESPNDTDSPSSTSCSCPPNACDCTNCETHGILNGYKLDELFGPSITDQKLLSFFTEIQDPTFNDMINNNKSGAVKLEQDNKFNDQANIGNANIGKDINDPTIDQFRQLFGSQTLDETAIQNRNAEINGYNQAAAVGQIESQVTQKSTGGGCCSKEE
ncbi:uncharacterized protein RJT20DRAFT_31395 [Scheffersomyces xylosifermentans]|uniref:uncharacterized protein n=1 Tax=Scheffersomyces xylosifermentans TaxID=1304137 RepID=UPI00315DE1A1